MPRKSGCTTTVLGTVASRQLMEAMYCGMRHPQKHLRNRTFHRAEITDRLLYDCYRVFYQPCNMALVVCGDVTPEEVLAVCDRVLPKGAVQLPIEREQPFTEPDAGVPIAGLKRKCRLQSRSSRSASKIRFFPPTRWRVRTALRCDESVGRGGFLPRGRTLQRAV